MAERSLRVAFVHPQMGLGGAERWVTDAASSLQQCGHRVAIWTAQFDRKRCFAPLANGSLDVHVRGGWLPGEILGRLRAPCNVARVAAVSAALAKSRKHYDIVITDLVSHTLPLLRRRTRLPVAFYCHYPDLLLAPRRTGFYAAYRRPIDRLEERGLEAADRVWVNSRFTASKFAATFPRAARPRVLYPGVSVDEFAAVPEVADHGSINLLALGRVDPAKNLELAIETLARLQAELPTAVAGRLRLQLAGGVDRNRAEVVALIRRLWELAQARGVASQLELIPNPTDAERTQLLAGSRCLIYTPQGEHFGLAPVEAMAAGRPVVAVHDGGPCETIVDGSCGKLRPPTGEAFANAVKEWVLNPAAARSYGAAGRARARDFSQQRLGESLEAELLELTAR